MKRYRHPILFGAVVLTAGQKVLAADLGLIEKAASEFAQRDDVKALVNDNRPRLADAYPLVVRDYFVKSAGHDPLPEPRPAQVEECARHYENVWLNRRFIWPTENDGTPDWQAIYIQALDHYLGFCLRQPR